MEIFWRNLVCTVLTLCTVMKQGLVRPLSRNSLIQKAIEIAQRQYGPVEGALMSNKKMVK